MTKKTIHGEDIRPLCRHDLPLHAADGLVHVVSVFKYTDNVDDVPDFPRRPMARCVTEAIDNLEAVPLSRMEGLAAADPSTPVTCLDCVASVVRRKW